MSHEELLSKIISLNLLITRKNVFQMNYHLIGLLSYRDDEPENSLNVGSRVSLRALRLRCLVVSAQFDKSRLSQNDLEQTI